MRIASAFLGIALAALPAAAAIDPDSALARSRAAIGSEPRDTPFTDVDGRRVRLSDYRGRPVVVSFVYTGCTQVCPTTTRFLGRAVAEARRVVGEDAFRVVSIGFNVPYDNPVSMRVFAKQNRIDDSRWSFLTPDAGATDALAHDFGFSYAAQSGGIDHLAQVTVLDAKGRVFAQVYGESFELPMLVAPLRALVLDEPQPASSFAQVVDRVRLICSVYDPVTGRYRLDYRLFIEIAIGFSCLALTAAFLWHERRRRRRRPC